MTILLTGRNGYIGSVLEPMLKKAGHNTDGFLTGAETVIYLEAVASQVLGEIAPKSTWEINYFDVIKCAQQAKLAGSIKRFIFPSAMSIFFNPESTYSKTKYMAECELMSLADENFKVIIIRPGVVWGTSPKMRYDTIVNNFLLNARFGLSNKPRNPSAKVPIINIKNLCHKFIEALDWDTTIVNAVDREVTAGYIAKNIWKFDKQ